MSFHVFHVFPDTVPDLTRPVPLSALNVGESATVERLLAKGAMRHRFLDIGLLPGTAVVCIGRSPAGDPSAYRIKGATVAIRAADAADVTVIRPADEGAT